MLREINCGPEIKRLVDVWLHRVDMEGEVVPLCSQRTEVDVHHDWVPWLGRQMRLEKKEEGVPSSKSLTDHLTSLSPALFPALHMTYLILSLSVLDPTARNTIS